MPMAIKFSAQTPYCAVNGFPVLRMPSALRGKVYELMQANKPDNML